MQGKNKLIKKGGKMVLKRATKKLAEAGKKDLEIHKCLWGYTVHHKKCTSQRSHVFQTPEEAVKGAIAGLAPTNIIHHKGSDNGL